MLVAGQGFGVGIENEQAAVAVHHDGVSAGDIGDKFSHADDRGDFHTGRHDGRVTGAAAGLRGEGINHAAVQGRGFTRRQIVGQDDHRLLEIAELLTPLTQQMFQDGPFDVEQVGRARGQVAPLEIPQGLGIAADDPAHGILGGEMLFADMGLDLAGQSGILDEDGMSPEDGAVLLAQPLVDGFLLAPGRRRGLGQGLTQALQLLGHPLRLHRPLRNAEPFGVQHQSRTDGHTGRHGNAAFDFHWQLSMARSSPTRI